MKLTNRFNDALVFAAQLHAGQVRKGTDIPYIAHLLAVASIALENGADEDEAIAALLHDAIEDRGGGKSVLLVSASDKLHNARAILNDYHQLGESLWDKFNGGRDGTLWYYRSLVETFKENEQSPKALINELEYVVSEIEHICEKPRLHSFYGSIS